MGGEICGGGGRRCRIMSCQDDRPLERWGWDLVNIVVGCW